MKVKDAMHKGVAWVAPDEPIVKVAVIMRDEDIGAIPVGENDRLIGMVTDRDIAVRGLVSGIASSQMTANEIMTHPLIYCRADDDIKDAVQLMEKNRIRRLPVIDKQKRMVGMLSLGDVAAAASPPICSEALRSVSAHHV